MMPDPVVHFSPAPSVRIIATYPATDGSMPETIEVVWETEFPNHIAMCRIINELCQVAVRRYSPHPNR